MNGSAEARLRQRSGLPPSAGPTLLGLDDWLGLAGRSCCSWPARWGASFNARAQDPDRAPLACRVEQLQGQALFAEAVSIAEHYVRRLCNSPARILLITAKPSPCWRRRTSQGRYAKAEPLYQEALSTNRKAVGADHLAVAVGLSELAVLHQAEERPARRRRQRTGADLDPAEGAVR
jgi:hypothetical protein